MAESIFFHDRNSPNPEHAPLRNAPTHAFTSEPVHLPQITFYNRNDHVGAGNALPATTWKLAPFVTKQPLFYISNNHTLEIDNSSAPQRTTPRPIPKCLTLCYDMYTHGQCSQPASECEYSHTWTGIVAGGPLSFGMVHAVAATPTLQ